MLSIGIGGQIGSGKTLVTRQLVRLYKKDGFSVKLIDADQIAWRLYRANSPVYKKIVRTFGKSILNKNKKIDRKKLAQQVFQNKTNLQRLNKIVHPALIKNLKFQLQNKDASVKILDAALLFLWGNKIPLNFRILVTAPYKQKIARMKKRGYNPQEVKKRLRRQMKECEMEQSADFVINNTNDLIELKKKMKVLYEIIRNH